MSKHLRRPAAILAGLLIVLLSVGISPAQAQTDPSGPSQYGILGPNPSGKLKMDGTPLISRQQSHAQKAPGTPFTAECPASLHCIVTPAAYVANGGNVADYGNFDLANRPVDMKVTHVVIHDTEGNCASAIQAFQDPTYYASSHYLVCKDGTVHQLVQTKNMAWHAGNWWKNMHSIGIEHEGNAADPHSYTPQEMWASAQLTKYLTSRFNIPRDRGHIIGHDNVPATRDADVAGMHVDPGPFWNWQSYMTLLGAPVLPAGSPLGQFVTVAPVSPLSKQPVDGCSAGSSSCVPAGQFPTNFVYLHTDASLSSPMIADPVTGQGSTSIANNAARVFYGQTLAVSGHKLVGDGIWYKVSVNGTEGWFFSPWSAPTGLPADADTDYVTTKTGVPVSVYGRPLPERSEYPADLLAVPPGSWYIPTPAPLTGYTLKSGQKYAVVDCAPTTDHFYAWTSDSSFPYDHTVWPGGTKYIEIQFGNRTGLVKQGEVNTTC